MTPSQLRCSPRAVAQYTAKGYVTLVTASKFFTGPPFSGAVVLPAPMAGEIEANLAAAGAGCAVPAGLADYLTPHEVPPGMPCTAAFLAHAHASGSQPTARQWFNAGLSLRWAVGLAVMEGYCALPDDAVARFTAAWVQQVRGLVAMHAPHLQLLAADEGAAEGNFAGGVNAIVSVSVHVPAAGGTGETGATRPLTLDESKLFHQMMTQVLATPDGDASTGHVRVLLGQPVKLSETATVVRIALGADMVVDALSSSSSSGGMGRILSEDVGVVQKMALLARHWEALTRPPVPTAAAAGGSTSSGTRSQL